MSLWVVPGLTSSRLVLSKRVLAVHGWSCQIFVLVSASKHFFMCPGGFQQVSGFWQDMEGLGGSLWGQRKTEGSTEAVYRFRKHWPVYTGLEKHMALYHLIMRP